MVDEGGFAGLTLYVNSAGYGQGQDYRWRRVDTSAAGAVGLTNGTDQALSNLDALLGEADSSTIVSIAWAHSQGQDWLLICNLASGRKDFNGRSIGNTVAWSAEPRAAAALRKIAVLCLADPTAFEALASALVTEAAPADSLGWAVDAVALRSLYGAADAVATSDGVAGAGRRYAGYAPEILGSLAAELAAAQPPGGDGVLVLVTPYHTAEALSKLQTWRAVTARPGIAPEWQALPALPALSTKGSRKGCLLPAAIAIALAALAVIAKTLPIVAVIGL